MRELVTFQVKRQEDGTDGAIAMKDVEIEVTEKVLKKKRL
jgi:hypothetical protein